MVRRAWALSQTAPHLPCLRLLPSATAIALAVNFARYTPLTILFPHPGCIVAVARAQPDGLPPDVTQVQMAERFDTLSGRRVYLVDARFDDSDIFMLQMEAWFREHRHRCALHGDHTQPDVALFRRFATRARPPWWAGHCHLRSGGRRAASILKSTMACPRPLCRRTSFRRRSARPPPRDASREVCLCAPACDGPDGRAAAAIHRRRRSGHGRPVQESSRP